MVVSYHYLFEVNNLGHNYFDHHGDSRLADVHLVLNHNIRYTDTHLDHDRYHFFDYHHVENHLDDPSDIYPRNDNPPMIDYLIYSCSPDKKFQDKFVEQMLSFC